MMERLTRLADQPEPGVKAGRYTAGTYSYFYESTVEAKIADRLAAYEDTGLEPEEIEKANKVIVSAFNLAVNSGTDMLIERLKEIIRAEAEGRLLVLPCKVGDMVYINTPSGATLCEVVDSITKPEFRTRTLEGLRGLDFDFHEFGKSVFLTREEAEAALKEESA